ncbi:hypothetical protein CDD83_8534 [Cordyceps sp. RAO-2017]|nr:hypothetical protein CDD83_8534 [Cordyceps sp. RAO-2017]
MPGFICLELRVVHHGRNRQRDSASVYKRHRAPALRGLEAFLILHLIASSPARGLAKPLPLPTMMLPPSLPGSLPRPAKNARLLARRAQDAWLAGDLPARSAFAAHVGTSSFVPLVCHTRQLRVSPADLMMPSHPPLRSSSLALPFEESADGLEMPSASIRAHVHTHAPEQAPYPGPLTRRPAAARATIAMSCRDIHPHTNEQHTYIVHHIPQTPYRPSSLRISCTIMYRKCQLAMSDNYDTERIFFTAHRTHLGLVLSS